MLFVRNTSNSRMYSKLILQRIGHLFSVNCILLYFNNTEDKIQPSYTILDVTKTCTSQAMLLSGFIVQGLYRTISITPSLGYPGYLLLLNQDS